MKTLRFTRAEWIADAACLYVPPDLFFPEPGASIAPAKAICGGCSVRDRCLDYAVNAEEALQGIWAGTTERQRRGMRARRAA